MNFFENHYNNTVKYDLINKFYYKNHEQIPKLNKIILNFNCKNINFKKLISSIIALELTTSQKSVITPSKKSNIQLKIRKGNPIGCKVTLRKENMYKFFFRLILEIFPNIKLFEGFSNKKFKNKIKSFSFKISKTLFTYELENQYHFFKDLPNLQIVIFTNSLSSFELIFFLKSYKFPIV
jgi:large subunit ribosomal protein L5